MGILDFHSNHIPRHATFSLTELGKSKAEDYTGDARTRVLMALEQDGASTAEEISRTSKIRKGKVERMIPSLIRGGYIQPIRSSIDD